MPPIEWPMTSMRPVHDEAIASIIASSTGVSSLPLWSLQAAQALPHDGLKICAFV